MDIKFTDSFHELKAKLNSLGGKWDENQSDKKVLRVNGGVLNWFETTGTLSVQGKEPGRGQLKNEVQSLLYPKEYKKSTTNHADNGNK